jgi:hypothetical protein
VRTFVLTVDVDEATDYIARFLGTTVARKGVIISGLTVGELLEEGKLWKKAQIQGHV